MALGTELTNETGEQTQAEAADPVVADLCALRRLAAQLHKRAATADDPMLRAILGKREALLNSIRAHLSPATGNAEDAPGECLADGADVSPERRRMIAKTVEEIAAMDRESERILGKRLAETTAEMRKLKAGRQWRESSQKWT